VPDRGTFRLEMQGIPSESDQKRKPIAGVEIESTPTAYDPSRMKSKKRFPPTFVHVVKGNLRAPGCFSNAREGE